MSDYPKVKVGTPGIATQPPQMQGPAFKSRQRAMEDMLEEYKKVFKPYEPHTGIQAIDDSMKHILEDMMGTRYRNEFEGETPKELIDNLQKKQAELQDHLDRLKQAEEKLKNFKFSAGDYAFVPEIGNVLIKSIYLNSKTEGGPEIMIEVVTIKGSMRINIDNVLPAGEATEVLYGKRKK
jgi:hypothetical protein